MPHLPWRRRTQRVRGRCCECGGGSCSRSLGLAGVCIRFGCGIEPPPIPFSADQANGVPWAAIASMRRQLCERGRRLGLGPDRLRKRRLHDRMRRMGLPGRMVAEARSEPVRTCVDTPRPSCRRCGSLAKFRPEAPREGRQEIRYPCWTNGPERSQGNRLNAVCGGQDARAPGRPTVPRRPCPRAELRS